MNDKRRGDPFGYGMVAYHNKKNKCFQCGVWTSGLHHVVPVSRGGDKQIPLCATCHNRAHDCEIVQPALILAGLAKAKARGVVFGAPIKLTNEVRQKIQALRGQGLSYKAIAKEVGVSVGTAYNAFKPKTSESEETNA